MLTVQIIARPDDLLDDVMSSVAQLGAEVQVVPGDTDEPRDSLRNRYASRAAHDWLLWLEPWEVLAQGHETLLGALREPGAYRVQVVEKTLVTKECRLWHREYAGFVNPVYESLNCEGAPLLSEAVVFSRKTRQDYMSDAKLLQDWLARSPLSSEPRYYQSCSLLAQGKYQEYIAVAEEFLFHQDEGVPAVMTRYYMGLVWLCVFKNHRRALSQAVACIAAQPLMAEFWCLAADSLYQAGEYARAKTLYENAVIVGQKRMQDDEFPIDISKYREHPERMIGHCAEAGAGSAFVASR